MTAPLCLSLSGNRASQRQGHTHFELQHQAWVSRQKISNLQSRDFDKSAKMPQEISDIKQVST